MNEWDTIRDMSKVWAEEKKKGFSKKNTVLLDNESRKFQDTPRNGIVVPEYGEAEVRSRSAHTLDTLLKYFLRMADQPELRNQILMCVYIWKSFLLIPMRPSMS